MGRFSVRDSSEYDKEKKDYATTVKATVCTAMRPGGALTCIHHLASGDDLRTTCQYRIRYKLDKVAAHGLDVKTSIALCIYKRERGI